MPIKSFRPGENARFFLFATPYVLLVLCGIYMRITAGSFPFLYPDSNSYLLPAIFKKLSGAWYLGDRPLQYIQFLYFALFSNDYLRTIVLVQQVLGIAGLLVFDQSMVAICR
jgi:hypothetical protein